ncbi:DUF6090 family protein [Lacinutrix iliipiscaria]|uniref:DUF6090 family protein n=1 Tax=Lacinutrix iliipiscaria TaxID=1230532 RepID=A0ABW5WK18_9FLAO
MKNKTSKYFKYAFGEIILVVIGILIALQINTWNENRRASNEETKILTALRTDFKDSKIRIEKTMSMQQKALNHSATLINIHERQDEKEFKYFDTNLDSLDNLIVYGKSWYRAEPVTGAYNALISAGKVDLIKNEKLRNILAQFSADLESGFEDQQTAMNLLHELTKTSSDILLKITSNKYRKRSNLNPRPKDTLVVAKKFFTNDSFFGNLLAKSYDENNRLARQQSMLDQTKAILEIIDKELNK